MNIFEKYQDNNQDLEFVFDQLNNRNFKVLPNTFAKGPVFKVTYDGDIEEKGYERGFLVLPKGSSIRTHLHTSDIEQYTLLAGNLSINGTSMDTNECLIGNIHSIDPVSELTIIKTIKISNQLLPTKAYQKAK